MISTYEASIAICGTVDSSWSALSAASGQSTKRCCRCRRLGRTGSDKVAHYPPPEEPRPAGPESPRKQRRSQRSTSQEGAIEPQRAKGPPGTSIGCGVDLTHPSDQRRTSPPLCFYWHPWRLYGKHGQSERSASTPKEPLRAGNKKPAKQSCAGFSKVAEREGFEPSIGD